VLFFLNKVGTLFGISLESEVNQLFLLLFALFILAFLISLFLGGMIALAFLGFVGSYIYKAYRNYFLGLEPLVRIP